MQEIPAVVQTEELIWLITQYSKKNQSTASTKRLETGEDWDGERTGAREEAKTRWTAAGTFCFSLAAMLRSAIAIDIPPRTNRSGRGRGRRLGFPSLTLEHGVIPFETRIPFLGTQPPRTPTGPATMWTGLWTLPWARFRRHYWYYLIARPLVSPTWAGAVDFLLLFSVFF
jgi:hypothetical protein